MSDGNGLELNTKATVAGGGAGTLLVVLANQLAPSNESLATILTYLAPTASVVAAAAWVLLAALAGTWRSRYVTNRALKRARDMQKLIFADPAATEKHKATVREKVEHFELLAISLIEAEFASVDVQLRP